ncbi:hypothetical protein M378DRAFT_17932 [Amanita muscaria Koide BX008]|uniref:Protein kinase domain-containing protein n=1 Tax=Amanita muscaria (strain Koide BX008) TaxID=946122 RepID=A0A0C2RYN1_AMAMK|nr:hypothetical protein M378DRAFT_17932 [Amanita muscaria Koide BX008]
MRSLLKFKPFIDVYHKSFLDFLQDSSRSGRYHVSNQGGQKRYLELIVDSVVQHVSMAIKQPNRHETCRSSPEFKYIISQYPPAIDLSVEDWEEALKPLLDLQDKLLNTSKLLPCRVTQAMRDLLLSLRILQSKPHPITLAQAPESNMLETLIKWSRALVTKAWNIEAENNLDSCLSLLLSLLQRTDPVMVVDMAIIDCMSSLLTFDRSETARRVRSVSDAQKLIDLVELLVNDRSFLNQCGPDAARKAAHLASEFFARVPLLPRSFLNGPLRLYSWNVELVCQTAFISRILNHDYMVSSFRICDKSDANESFDRWLQRSNPSFSTRIRVMLEIARIIRYIHSMDIALLAIDSGVFVLDSNLRAKILLGGLSTWWGSEARIYGHEDTRSLQTYESNISDFAVLFHSVCFDGDNIPLNNVNGPVENARKVIERCRAEDAKSRPTMEDVVKEMETWDLT